MEYLGIKITWGCTIYNDDTISKTVTTQYEDLKSVRQAWENLKDDSGNGDVDRRVRLLSLSIETKKFVPSEEYFKYMEEEE